MEKHTLWPTTVIRVNLADKEDIDLDQLAQEIILNYGHADNTHKELDDHGFMVQGLVNLREKYITPLVKKYLSEEFRVDLDHYDVTVYSFPVSITGDMEHHYHPKSTITTIFYPLDATAMLVLLDPRGASCRGYPAEMMRDYFGSMRITPVAGDLWIIPSFLAHQVRCGKEEMRLSFVSDYHIEVKGVQ